MTRFPAGAAVVLGLGLAATAPANDLPRPHGGTAAAGYYYLPPVTHVLSLPYAYPCSPPFPPFLVPATTPGQAGVPAPRSSPAGPRPNGSAPKKEKEPEAKPPADEAAPARPKDAGKAPQAAVEEERPFQVYPVAPGGSLKLVPERVSAAFWNLTGKELTLRVAGESHVLAPGKRVTLDLERAFEWQVNDRPAERQKVQPAEAGVEIILRQ